MLLLIRALRRFYRLVYIEKLGRLLPGAAVSSGSPEKAAVALSFDDGPNPPYTQQVLDILDQHRVQATFFLVGVMFSSIPLLFRKSLHGVIA